MFQVFYYWGTEWLFDGAKTNHLYKLGKQLKNEENFGLSCFEGRISCRTSVDISVSSC